MGAPAITIGKEQLKILVDFPELETVKRDELWHFDMLLGMMG